MLIEVSLIYHVVLVSGVISSFQWTGNSISQGRDWGRDFLDGAVVKNPPTNVGYPGFNSWSVKIPHATEQLSLSATTIEPML